MKCGNWNMWNCAIMECCRLVVILCITNQDQRYFVIFGIFIISLSLDFIVAHVADAKYFATMADKTTDVSQKEQMTLVIRYVDKDVVVLKIFLVLSK